MKLWIFAATKIFSKNPIVTDKIKGEIMMVIRAIALLSGASLCVLTSSQAIAANVTDGSGQVSPVSPGQSAGPADDAHNASSGANTTNSGDASAIVVTAQRREQRIQDVPIAITAASGAQLAARGVTDTSALSKIAPGVQISQFGGSSAITSVTIRGVAQLDYTDHQESPNAVYLDGAYVSFQGATGIGLYDINRVEVLRGPQGTLFGRNATGGLVQIISNQPTDKTSGYMNVTYGSYNLARVEAAAGGALTDTLSMRAAFLFNRQDGYIHNSLGPDGGQDKSLSGRVQLKWKPISGVSNLLQVFVSDTPSIGGGLYPNYPSAPDPANHGLPELTSGPLFVANCQALGYGTPPVGSSNCLGYHNPYNSPFQVAAGQAGTFRRTIWGVTDTLSVDINAVNVTSITNYTNVSKNYGEDDDASPLDIASYTSHMRAHQFSQEIRLSGKIPRLQWSVGAYYLHIFGNYGEETDLTDSFGVTGGNLYSQQVDTASVFGQAEYQFADKIGVIGGLRWTTDRKRFDFTNLCSLDDAGCAADDFAPNGYRLGGSYTRSDWSGRFQLTYKPTSDVLLYAGVNRGNKGSLITAPAPASVGQTFSSLVIQPEVLTAYETGFKTSVFDRRIHINGDVFYYKYHNFQAYSFSGLTAVIFNAEARNFGGEAEISGQLTKTISASLSAAYVHTRVLNVTLPDGTQANEQSAYAPKISLTGSLTKVVPTSIGDFSAEVGANYQSSLYFSTINSPAVHANGYINADCIISWKDKSQRVSFSVQSLNFLNKRYATYGIDFSGIDGTAARNYAQPRTFRATLGYRF